MRVNRLYCAEAIDRSLALPRNITLNEKVTHYLSNVLRLKAGARICVFDGHGGEYSAEVATIERRRTTVRLTEFIDADRRSPLSIQLAIGLSRSDRFDLVLQKATELGVNSIQPLLCHRSDRKPKAQQLEKKQQHWQGVVSSACEQSGLNVLPIVETPLTVEKWLSLGSCENALLLHPHGKALSMESIVDRASNSAKFCVAVGPEGGFSQEESDQFQNKGFEKLSLGPRILRTETAPLAIVSILQFAAGDLA